MTSPVKELGGKALLKFDQLQLPVGTSMQLETRLPKARYRVQYIGYMQERSLLVALPIQGAGAPLLTEGTAVTLRFMASDRACAFTTRVLRSATLPYTHLHLDYPRSVEAVVVRQSMRTQTALIVSVDEVEEGALGGGWPRQALCHDLSLDGGRIESSRELGEIGDELHVTARVEVAGVDQVMLLHAEIRSVELIEDAESGEFRFSHGVFFVDPDEETRLILAGFVYQQMLRERGVF